MRGAGDDDSRAVEQLRRCAGRRLGECDDGADELAGAVGQHFRAVAGLGVRQEHDRINEKSWFTYESGNLFALLGPSQVPRSILNVQFYASGHQYDVSLGEISLLAGQFATSG